MALIPQAEDLFKEMTELQRIRKNFHEAYITEAKAKGGKSPAQPPSMTPPRTLDNPTLEILKSSNYPFLLCEEAPPAYIPPPVPFDVDGEVDHLKQHVLSVQESLQAYQDKLERHRAAPAGSSALSREDLLEFFSGNSSYAELAWGVSSLQWFYRWVLSHSISHLWNAKEAVEYVLTDGGQELPSTAEEMDECLLQYPFTRAVSILDHDRQSVIAQERRRLRSVSQTYRNRLPAHAITAATSSYLSTEEKYMYQEFFNQSEHLILLFNHAMMLEKAGSAASNSRTPSVARSSTALSASQLRRAEGEDMVVRHRGDELPEATVLVDDAVGAMTAEREVIATLLETIEERRRSNTTFDISPEERGRSRTAQVAVYGCIVSDMSLMGQQMDVAAEFIEKYEEWLRFHGFKSHDALMELLSRRGGGTRWPVLPKYNTSEGLSHPHFIPPTEELKQQFRYAHPAAGEDGHAADDESGIHRSDPTASRPSFTPSSAAQPPLSPTQQQKKQPAAAAATGKKEARPEPSEQSRGPRSPPPSRASERTDEEAKLRTEEERERRRRQQEDDWRYKRQHEEDQRRRQQEEENNRRKNEFPNDAAQNFYTILCHVDNCLDERSVDDNEATLDRMWLIASLRFTVARLTVGAWSSADLRRNIIATEDTLGALLRAKPTYAHLIPDASAFMFVLEELAVLLEAQDSPGRKCTTVRVAVNKRDNVKDTRKSVIYTMTPVETERWGVLLDALWFQADPSSAANGDALNTREGPNRANGFMRIHRVALPSDSTRYMTLFYRINGTALDAGARPFSEIIASHPVFQGEEMVRLIFVRRVLVALREVESKGLLPCYACRPDEAATVVFARQIYLTLEGTNPVGVTMLPPAAVQLRRIDMHVGSKSTFDADGDVERFVAPYTVPRNFSTIGFLISSMLSEAAAQSPTFHDMYMTAEATREQALYEIASDTPCKAFTKASMHPVPMSCMPVQKRAMSIQHESVIGNRNTATSLRNFTLPLLRQVEDSMSLLQEASKTSASNGAQQTRPTVHGGDVAKGTSPSAVRPGRR